MVLGEAIKLGLDTLKWANFVNKERNVMVGSGRAKNEVDEGEMININSGCRSGQIVTGNFSTRIST